MIIASEHQVDGGLVISDGHRYNGVARFVANEDQVRGWVLNDRLTGRSYTCRKMWQIWEQAVCAIARN